MIPETANPFEIAWTALAIVGLIACVFGNRSASDERKAVQREKLGKIGEMLAYTTTLVYLGLFLAFMGLAAIGLNAMSIPAQPNPEYAERALWSGVGLVGTEISLLTMALGLRVLRLRIEDEIQKGV